MVTKTTTPKKPITAPAASTSSCMLVFLTLLGWGFDIFTVIVNITDVVSDALVCAQFYEAGEYGWFGGVIGTLFIGNVVFTAIFVIADPGKICERIFNKRLPKWLIFLLVVPVAQAVPVAAWIYNTFISKSDTNQQQRDREEKLFDTSPVEQRTGAGAEAMEEASSTLQLVGRLRGAIKQHIVTHAYFYTETAVESIPQVVLQLLAVTFLQDVSTVQVVSMASSLLSIVSKGYIFAASATVPTIFWKFFCCAADLFCTFYIFSTIFLRGEDVEGLGGMVPITDTISMPMITVVWLGKIGLNVGLALIGLFVLACTSCRIIGRSLRNMGCKEFWAAIGCFFLGIIVLGPALILIESAKFISLVLLVSKTEQINATSTLLHSFLYGAGVSAKELNARVKFLTSLFLEGFKVPFGRKQFTHTTYERCQPHLWTTANKTMTQALLKADYPNGYHEPTSTYSTTTTTVAIGDTGTIAGPADGTFDLPEVSIGGGSTTSRPVSEIWREFGCNKEIIRTFAAGVWVVIYAIGQVYSLVFPFVSYGLYFNVQNLLQHVCFICYAFCVLVMLVLSPHVVQYMLFFMKYGDYISHFQASGSDTGGGSAMFAAIEQYFTPPVGALLRQAVPPEALPAELCNIVGRFMVSKDLKLTGVGKRDFKRVQDDEDALENRV